MQHYHVGIKDNPDASACAHQVNVADGQNLLAAFEKSAVDTGVDIGCRGGGCGVCKIRILSGSYRKRVMSKAHISPQDLANGIVLACRVFPESDMEIAPEPPVQP